ncbi:MAG: hypothetical protein V9G24_19235 [Rhodoblastus sp.]
MGSSESNELGYAPAASEPMGRNVREARAQGRDVYLFFISGFKQRNPAAAMALIERLR